MISSQPWFSLLVTFSLLTSLLSQPIKSPALKADSSPQGRIAFIQNGNIWITGTDGSGLKQITNRGNYKEVSWSPDGSKLAFVHLGIDLTTQREADEIGYYNLVTQTEKIVVPPEKTPFLLLDTYYNFWNPRWSPNSSTIYYIASDGRVQGDFVHTININTLLRDAGFTKFFSRGFDVSPVDGRIVFIDFSNGIPSGYNLNLANANGSARFPLFPIQEGVWVHGVAWSRDGSQMIFSAEGGSYGQGSIAVMLPSGSIQKTWSAPGSGTVTFSPDRGYAAYDSGDAINLLNLLSGTVGRLASGNSPSWDPSPTGFLPNPDGYQFRNQSRPRPSWEIYKQTFSNSSLEYLFGVRKPVAWAFYEGIYKKSFEGMCDGLSSSSLAYYAKTETRPGGITQTYAMSPASAWPLIELYHGRQLSKGLQNYRNNLWANYPGVSSIYNQIKSQLPDGKNDPIILSITPGSNNTIPSNQRFGHSLIPYRIEEKAGAWGKVYVYDPNWPGDTNKYFYFDFQSSPNTFDYDMGAPIPTNGTGNYHVNSKNGWIIGLTPSSQFNSYDAKVLHDGIFGFLLGNGEVLHTNSTGRNIGYRQGILIADIAGAAPIYPGVSLPFESESFGVSLPPDTYQVSISNSDSYEYSASSLTNFVDIKAYADETGPLASLANSAGYDYLQVGITAETTYTTTSTMSRSLSLTLTGSDSITERQYEIRDTKVSDPTVLRAQLIRNGLYLKTLGIDSSFDLVISGPEGNTTGLFVHHEIPIASGSEITVEAPNISPSSLITVTLSSGGTISQVLVLNNQVRQVFLPVIQK